MFRHCIFVEIHAIQYEIHQIRSLGDATIMLIGVVSFLRDYRAQAAVRYSINSCRSCGAYYAAGAPHNTLFSSFRQYNPGINPDKSRANAAKCGENKALYGKV